METLFQKQQNHLISEQLVIVVQMEKNPYKKTNQSLTTSRKKVSATVNKSDKKTVLSPEMKTKAPAFSNIDMVQNYVSDSNYKTTGLDTDNEGCDETLSCTVHSPPTVTPDLNLKRTNVVSSSVHYMSNKMIATADRNKGMFT